MPRHAGDADPVVALRGDRAGHVRAVAVEVGRVVHRVAGRVDEVAAGAPVDVGAEVGVVRDAGVDHRDGDGRGAGGLGPRLGRADLRESPELTHVRIVGCHGGGPVGDVRLRESDVRVGLQPADGLVDGGAGLDAQPLQARLAQRLLDARSGGVAHVGALGAARSGVELHDDLAGHGVGPQALQLCGRGGGSDQRHRGGCEHGDARAPCARVIVVPFAHRRRRHRNHHRARATVMGTRWPGKRTGKPRLTGWYTRPAGGRSAQHRGFTVRI